jgi:hypothetical protein
MSRRILELSLLAFPRHIRQRDGEHLLELADELADRHGVGREALGLLRGGLAERRRRRGPTRRVTLAMSAAIGSVLVIVSWSAAAEPLRFEEDRYSCAGECADLSAQVADRERQGWTCTGQETATTVTWRCTRD